MLFLPRAFKNLSSYSESENIARKELSLSAEFQPLRVMQACEDLPSHDKYHTLCSVLHGHGDFWYSANTLPLRKLEHLISFKPLILTNTPGKLRSGEIKYLDSLCNIHAASGMFFLPPSPLPLC